MSNTFVPFATSPTNYIQGAQQPATPQPGQVPVSANQLTPGNNLNLAPGHAALLNQLQGSLQQNSLPTLMQQILNNPALAKQLGGSTSTPYTPAQPTNAWRSNFEAPVMPQTNPQSTQRNPDGSAMVNSNAPPQAGWGNGGIGQNISLFGNGTPYQAAPSLNPIPGNPMGMGAAPAVIDPSSQNAAYQAWLLQQSQQQPQLSQGN